MVGGVVPSRRRCMRTSSCRSDELEECYFVRGKVDIKDTESARHFLEDILCICMSSMTLIVAILKKLDPLVS